MYARKLFIQDFLSSALDPMGLCEIHVSRMINTIDFLDLDGYINSYLIYFTKKTQFVYQDSTKVVFDERK